MSQLQIAFTLIGVVLIIAIIGHGLWSIRRQNSSEKAQRQALDRKRRELDSQGFDADGIGTVRVRKTTSNDQVKAQTSETLVEHSDEGDNDLSGDDLFGLAADEPIVPKTPSPSTTSAKRQPTAPAEPTSEASLEAPLSEPPNVPQDTKPEKRSTAETKAPSKPTQMDLSIDEVTETGTVTQDPEEVIVLHVTGDIQGAILLQQMTELGFKFGEFDIFHRHETTAGTGPVLFSLANMFNPGVFDLDSMETFKTQGVALFLALPVKGSATQAFTMMHNAASKLAQAVGGQVLDQHRNPLTRQTVQHIQQRIREFERKQLLRS